MNLVKGRGVDKEECSDKVRGGGAGELGQWKGGGAGGVHCDQVRGGGAGDLKLFGIYALNLLTSELSWG